MKTYLARYTQFDGEHEHACRLLIKAKNEEEVVKLAKEQEFDCEDDTSNENEEENYKHFSYGDGQTGCRFNDLTEITEEEANILERLGVVSYL